MPHPLIERLDAAAAEHDSEGIRACLAEMTEFQKANFVKAALLSKPVPDAVWQVLPHIDPNMPMYGGDLLANIAAHGDSKADPDDFLTGLKLMLFNGGDPNAAFSSTVAGDGARPLTIFSMTVLPRLLEAEIPLSIYALLNTMCKKGLILEKTDREPSKLQQITELLHPAYVLERVKYEKRAKAVREAEKNAYPLGLFASDPIRSVENQARQIYEILCDNGADKDAKFSNPDGSPGLTAEETLGLYQKNLRDLRRDPKDSDALEKSLVGHMHKDGWPNPEFVLDSRTLDDLEGLYLRVARILNEYSKSRADFLAL